MRVRNVVIESHIATKSPKFGLQSLLWLVRMPASLYHRKWF